MTPEKLKERRRAGDAKKQWQKQIDEYQKNVEETYRRDFQYAQNELNFKHMQFLTQTETDLLVMELQRPLLDLMIDIQLSECANGSAR